MKYFTTTLKRTAKKIPDSFYTFFTLAAAAQINYAIVHSSFVYVALLVMLIHELGHYYTSKKYTNKSKLPLFVPFPFFVIGITRVPKLSSAATKHIAISGPLFGATAAGLIFVLNLIFNFTSSIPILFLMLGELIFNYIGADGVKYRKAKKDYLLCTS